MCEICKKRRCTINKYIFNVFMVILHKHISHRNHDICRKFCLHFPILGNEDTYKHHCHRIYYMCKDFRNIFRASYNLISKRFIA